MGDMRIMLVDDNGDLRRGMRDYLARQEGMKVVAECPSGAEALEALGKVRVDVMVLDLIMPQMDGFALMEEVRRQQLANPPQIIVVSALGTSTENVLGLRRDLFSVDESPHAYGSFDQSVHRFYVANRVD